MAIEIEDELLKRLMLLEMKMEMKIENEYVERMKHLMCRMYRFIEDVWNPTEDQPPIITDDNALDEMEIGDKEYGSLSSLSRKLLQEAAAFEKMGGSSGYEYLRVEPNMGEMMKESLNNYVWNPIEDQLLTIPGHGLDEMEVVDKAHGSVSCFPHKDLQKTGKSQEDFLISYIEDSGGSTLIPGDGLHRNMGTAKSGGILGMQGGLMILMFAVNAQEAAAVDKMGGSNGYKYLPVEPDMGGTGQFAGTWVMQGGLAILIFAVSYFLYMILKKRVCSFSIGWKDTDAGGDLELGGPRDA